MESLPWGTPYKATGSIPRRSMDLLWAFHDVNGRRYKWVLPSRLHSEISVRLPTGKGAIAPQSLQTTSTEPQSVIKRNSNLDHLNLSLNAKTYH